MKETNGYGRSSQPKMPHLISHGEPPILIELPSRRRYCNQGPIKLQLEAKILGVAKTGI